MTRTLREFGVTPEPRYWRRSRMGSNCPRTLAMPFTQVLAPGMRVRPGGTASTSRVSSRAARYSSPAMRNATPTHSRAPGFSEAAAAVTARPRRSSSARSSKGRSRRLLRDEASVISGGERGLRFGDELIRRDGLDHVVHRALAQAPDLVRLLPFRRDHDDRNGLRLRIVRERARRLVAIDARHDDVHEDQIGRHLARHAHAFG